jgi:hypothetical protein
MTLHLSLDGGLTYEEMSPEDS